jgi:hypothetical protein
VPTIQGISGPYRFFFYSFDCIEQPHIHVRREKKSCKFWLDPLELARNNRFSANELNTIRRLIADNAELIQHAWDEHCDEQ